MYGVLVQETSWSGLLSGYQRYQSTISVCCCVLKVPVSSYQAHEIALNNPLFLLSPCVWGNWNVRDCIRQNGWPIHLSYFSCILIFLCFQKQGISLCLLANQLPHCTSGLPISSEVHVCFSLCQQFTKWAISRNTLFQFEKINGNWQNMQDHPSFL